MTKQSTIFTRELPRPRPGRAGRARRGRSMRPPRERAAGQRILALEIEAGRPEPHGDRVRAAAPARPARRPLARRRSAGRARRPRLAVVGRHCLPAAGATARSRGLLDEVGRRRRDQPPTAAAHPYTYLKTREVAVDTAGAGDASWSVLQSTTREEWVAHDGSGTAAGGQRPARVPRASANRAEWEAAGEPRLPRPRLRAAHRRPLARRRRRWRRGAEELPADPDRAPRLACATKPKSEPDRRRSPPRPWS